MPPPAAAPMDPFGVPPAVPPPAPPAASFQTYAPAPTPDQNSFASPMPPAPAPQTLASPMPPAPAPQTLATPMPPVPAESPVVATDNPALSMAPQPTGLGTDANAAYEKFAKMDQFDLVSKGPEKNRENPFDFAPAPAAPAPSLSSMKASHAGVEKKEVMKSAMVVSTGAQQGNWGGHAPQPVMGQTMGYYAQNQPSMTQGYGQQMNNTMNSSVSYNNNGQTPGMGSAFGSDVNGNNNGLAQQSQYTYNNAPPAGYGQQQSYYGGQA